MSKMRRTSGLRRGALLVSLSAIGLCAGACTLLLTKEPLSCANDGDCTKYPGTTCDLASQECHAGTTQSDGSSNDGPIGTDSSSDAPIPFDGPDPCANPNKPLVPLMGDISSNLTLSCEKDYLIVGRVAIAPPYVLTIPAGTTLYGDTHVDATTSTLGTLVVPAGARIVATGTADKPIVFTSAKYLGAMYAVDGGAAAGSGDWGGVFIFGQAPVNTPTGTSVKPALAPWGQFGGGKSNDDSGRLEYVRIEYAGAKLPDGQDGTSLDLGGVGDQTTIDHVMVRFSANDCFEVLGGRVNLKHVLCQFPSDDGIAWENGWTGKAQFIVVQGRPGVDDTANGLQGRSGGATDTPFSEPQIYNGTFCGQNVVPGVTFQYGVRAEKFTHLHLFNSVFMGWQATVDLRGSGTTVFDDTASDGGAPPAIEFKSSVAFANITANVAFNEGLPAGDGNNDNGFDEGAWWVTPSFNNSQVDPGIPKCFDAVAPRFAAPGPIAGPTSSQPPNDGFFDPSAKYVGAFRDQSDLWATGKWVRWDNK